MAEGIEDPLVRAMDNQQRLAMLRRVILDAEQEIARAKQIAQDTRDMFKELDKMSNEATRVGQ